MESILGPIITKKDLLEAARLNNILLLTFGNYILDSDGNPMDIKSIDAGALCEINLNNAPDEIKKFNSMLTAYFHEGLGEGPHSSKTTNEIFAVLTVEEVETAFNHLPREDQEEWLE